MNRFQLIRQRVLRNDLFRPKNLHERPMEITPVASLLGGKKDRASLSLLLGVLVRTSETTFALEDTTGQVALDFTHAEISDGSVIVEHSILLVEGTFEDQLLYIHRLGQPVPESREESLKALGPQLSHSHYAVPKTLPATVAVLHGCSDIDKVLSKSRPDVLVVLLSPQDDLATIPDQSAMETKLVVVPTCQTAVWPMPPLSSKTSSNPCRIRVPHELVIWNAPMRQFWNEQSLRLGDQSSWITTPLHQGTLAPPATTPVHWNYAHAMSLYPVPDALVVVGGDTEIHSHGDCEILQMQQEEGGSYAVFDEDGWHLCSMEN